MEADWQRSYSRDLRDDLFGEPGIGLRRLRALVFGLPPDAMLWRQRPAWGTAEELAALNVEVAHSTMRVLLSAYGRKGASVPKPLRIPRPETTERRRPRRRRPVSEARMAEVGGSVRRIGVAARDEALRATERAGADRAGQIGPPSEPVREGAS